MVDTVDPVLGTTDMATDEHEDDWGDVLDANQAIVNDRLVSTEARATTGGTITAAQADLRPILQRVTGSLSSNVVIEVPSTIVSWWNFENATTGAYTVTVKVSGQTGVVIPQGSSKIVRNNGTDVVEVFRDPGRVNWVGTFAGAADAYTAGANGFIPATLRDGIRILGIIQAANATVTPAFNYALTGAKTIVLETGAQPAVGDLPLNAMVELVYVLAADKWYARLRPSLSTMATLSGNNAFTGANSHAGIETFTRGIIAAATSLTDAASAVWNMGNTSPNVYLLATSGVGSTRQIANPSNVNVGQRGLIIFQQDGTGSRLLTFAGNFIQMGAQNVDPSANAYTIFEYYAYSASIILVWPLYRSQQNAIRSWKEIDMGACSFPQTKTQAHGLSNLPSLVVFYLECTTTDGSYAATSRVLLGGYSEGDNNRGITCSWGPTSVTARLGNNPIKLVQTDGSLDTITGSRWKVIARVYE